MLVHRPLTSLAIIGSAWMTSVFAICPGYNYAFWNIGSNWWYITDDSCSRVHTALCDNPCNCHGVFSCSPPPVHVDGVVVNGLYYYCRDDPNKGYCGDSGDQTAGRSPESCCRNDGRRNFEEGLITKRHLEAIEATNEILDRHIVEYDEAAVKGRDLVHLRTRQAAEVKDSMKREAAIANTLE